MLRKSSLTLLVALVLSFYSYSSHITGGFFEYECLGNDEYLITLNLFRDCSGITMPTSVFVDFTSTCGGNSNATLNLDQSLLPANMQITADGGGHISQICTPQLLQTTCYGGTIPGNELYIYQATVTLSPPCDTWTMSWGTCCRNTTVNVPTSSGDGVFLEATLNSLTAPCNSSPSFLTPYPIYYACANQQSVINYSIAEPDNDSLVYSLIGAYESAGLNLTYGGGYSGASPIPGIVVDPLTGEITVTPTALGNFIIALQVEEYDILGNLLGTTFIDAQIVVQTCTNNVPNTPIGTIENFSGTGAVQTGPNSIDLCLNDNFCFDVSFADADMDVLTIFSNVDSILPGATLTFDNSVPGTATATVCWTATPNFQGSTIVIYANDENCPIPGVVAISVDVNINLGTYAGVDGLICGNMSHQMVASGGTVFNWSVVSGDPIIIGTNFSANPSQIPVATPSQTTTYEVISNLGGTCSNVDYVTVVVQQNLGDINIISTTANPDLVCMGDTSRLEILTVQPPPICDEYAVSNIPFAPEPGTGTAINLNDDQLSTALPIGFSFEFFCNVYTDFYISSNGFITFNGGSGNGCCSGDFIPSPFDPNDIIALAWEDLDPFGYGTIEYFTIGAAPDRILVVNFLGIAHYPGPGPNSDVTVQALLYETSNAIEIHTTTQPDAGGMHTMGIEDATGVNGYAVPGRNSQSWTATNDAYRFESLSNPPDPYTYLWSPGGALDDDTLSAPLATLSGTTEFIVTVFDDNMCWESDTVSVTATNPFGLSASGITSSCAGVNNGGATITVNGGIGPFDYLWPSGETSSVSTGLAPGIQNVTVYDTGAGCSKDTAITIPASALGITITGFTFTDETCFGFSDGTATVTSTNGSGGLTYDWGASISSTVAFASNVPAGTHTLVVEDVVGCRDDTTFTVSVPPILSVTGSTTSISTCNQENGSASITGVIGGPSSIYMYQWDNGQTNAFLTNVSSGQFCVTIVDLAATGCYTTHCVSVSTTPFPTAITNSTPATCNTDCDGTGTILVTPILGGSSVFTYQWDAGAGFQNGIQAINLCAGTHDVTATDATGCYVVSTATVTEPTAVSVTPNASQTAICYGQATNLSAIATGGNGAPYSYTWDAGMGSPIIVNPIVSSFYQVTATDVNNCAVVSIPLMINVKPLIQATSTPSATICNGVALDLWSFAWGGNGGPYSYSWDHLIGNGSAHTTYPNTYPLPDFYVVTISDGCSPDLTDTVNVSYYPTPAPLVTATEYEGCQPFTTTISPVSGSVSNITTCLWQLQDGTFITDNSCGSFVHTFSNVDWYDVTLSVISGDGCSAAFTYFDMITVNELPIADFSSTVDPTILDTEIDFTDESYGAVNLWDWTFYYSDGVNILGNDTLQNPSFTYPVDTGYYSVKLDVETVDGCIDDTTKVIFINGQYMMYIPNAFSPNGDGKNDIFRPIGTGFSQVEEDYSLEIFDRWGKRIFLTKSPENGWNGKNDNGNGEYVPNGVYVYKVTSIKSTERWEDGEFNTTPFEYIGHITFFK